MAILYFTSFYSTGDQCCEIRFDMATAAVVQSYVILCIKDTVNPFFLQGALLCPFLFGPRMVSKRVVVAVVVVALFCVLFLLVGW